MRDSLANKDEAKHPMGSTFILLIKTFSLFFVRFESKQVVKHLFVYRLARSFSRQSAFNLLVLLIIKFTVWIEPSPCHSPKFVFVCV